MDLLRYTGYLILEVGCWLFDTGQSRLLVDEVD